MTIFVIWLLKTFGVLWVLGGAFVIRQSWVEIFLDRAIDKVETLSKALGADGPDVPNDPGRAYWLLVGGILTVLSGIGLIVTHRYVLIPLSLLVVQQGLYAWRQWRMAERADSEEAAEDARMTPQARNGAIIAVGVWVVVLSLAWTGAIG